MALQLIKERISFIFFLLLLPYYDQIEAGRSTAGLPVVLQAGVQYGFAAHKRTVHLSHSFIVASFS